MIVLLATAALGATKVCVRFDATYSGPDGAGDYWIVDAIRPLPGVRILLQSMTTGATAFNGYAQASGANTGCVSTNNTQTGVLYRVWVYSESRVASNNTVRVFDAQSVNEQYGPGNGSPFSNFSSYTVHNWHTTITLPPTDWARVLGAAAWSVQRRTAGLSNETFRLFVNFSPNHQSPCGGSCFVDDDEAIFLNTQARFVIAHELGHAVGAARNGWVSTASDSAAPFLPCPGVANPGLPSHAMDTKEYQSIASSEGFAHYYAAVSFNNSGQQDCSFSYYKPIDFNHDGVLDDFIVDCEGSPNVSAAGGPVAPGDYLGDQCGGGLSNRGSEYDWLRFFWDLDTNPSTGGSIHTTQIADIWDYADPYSWRPSDVPWYKTKPWPRINSACNTLNHSCGGSAQWNGVNR